MEPAYARISRCSRRVALAGLTKHKLSMQLTSEQQKNVFRLAAIIYGRSAKGVSLDKSFQKVVDDALFCCGKTAISVTDLIVYIKDNYGFLYTDKEIIKVVSRRDGEQKYHTYIQHGEYIISLTVEYKNRLTIICQEKTLYDFIDEYQANLGSDDIEIKELIFRFLYNMFTSNLEGYKLILQENYYLATNSADYTEKEKEVINGFLNWSDDGKNKAVFDLAGYALEYCMMTNKKNTSLNTQNLKNKFFYIDTNILYRAIGLNGESLKTRANLFLAKFKEVGEKLVISQSTYVEFITSVDYYIDRIDRAQRPRVRPEVISEFINEDNVFLYYNKWCIGRANRGTDIFKDWIMSEYDALCTHYEIARESKYPFDRESRKKEIQDYSASIASSSPDKPVTSADYDAENVLWVEEKRKGSADNIYQAKAFLLSSDNALRRWDYQRNFNRVPIVMSPGQWMGIILQYIERTSDDYRSFISFLTLNIRQDALPIETLSTIITGISQTTNDIETQQYLVRNFIERKTFAEMEDMSDEELEKAAEEFGNTELEKRIANLEAIQKKSEKELDATKKNLSETQRSLSKLQNASAELQEDSKFRIKTERERKERALDENSQLKEKLNRYELREWRRKFIFLWLLIIVIFTMLGLMMFLWLDADWNILAKFVALIDTRKESSASKVGEAVVFIPVMVVSYAFRMIYKSYKIKKYDADVCNYLWLK